MTTRRDPVDLVREMRAAAKTLRFVEVTTSDHSLKDTPCVISVDCVGQVCDKTLTAFRAEFGKISILSLMFGEPSVQAPSPLPATTARPLPVRALRAATQMQIGLRYVSDRYQQSVLITV